jgi:GalNAc5-diNAcBac-PP-undecaprenol beta-1,3-glucosyltransferase
MISVSIPTYYTEENTERIIEGIEFSFNKLFLQDYKDFEVIISDHSIGEQIESLCDKWKNKLNIKYFKNDFKRGFLTANENFGIQHSTGDIIKFLDQDDYMLNEHSLTDTEKYFDDGFAWMATAYYHTKDRIQLENVHFPAINNRIHYVNTIGTPSCVSIRNKDVIYFDDNLKWAGDCEYYKRLYDKFGMPKLINYMTIVQYLWGGQTTHSYDYDKALQEKEIAYIIEKHGEVVIEH